MQVADSRTACKPISITEFPSFSAILQPKCEKRPLAQSQVGGYETQIPHADGDEVTLSGAQAPTVSSRMSGAPGCYGNARGPLVRTLSPCVMWSPTRWTVTPSLSPSRSTNADGRTKPDGQAGEQKLSTTESKRRITCTCKTLTTYSFVFSICGWFFFRGGGHKWTCGVAGPHQHGIASTLKMDYLLLVLLLWWMGKEIKMTHMTNGDEPGGI